MKKQPKNKVSRKGGGEGGDVLVPSSKSARVVQFHTRGDGRGSFNKIGAFQLKDILPPILAKP